MQLQELAIYLWMTNCHSESFWYEEHTFCCYLGCAFAILSELRYQGLAPNQRQRKTILLVMAASPKGYDGKVSNIETEVSWSWLVLFYNISRGTYGIILWMG